jgi:hypothetical protein
MIKSKLTIKERFLSWRTSLVIWWQDFLVMILCRVFGRHVPVRVYVEDYNPFWPENPEEKIIDGEPKMILAGRVCGYCGEEVDEQGKLKSWVR